MLRETHLSAKQERLFEAKVRAALVDIGATPGEPGTTDADMGRLYLMTIHGRLRLSPYASAIRTQFDKVPDVRSLMGASLNPYSGKWNFEFSMKPSQDELDRAIAAIKAILPN